MAAVGAPRSSQTDIQRIVSWHDVGQFADEIVAYKTHSHYIGYKDADRGYSLCSQECLSGDGSVRFGYIRAVAFMWKGEGYNSKPLQGYNMARLLKWGSVPGNCALVQPHIDEGLWMRRATVAEVEEILRAIESGQAELEYQSKAKAVAAISKKSMFPLQSKL